jgi:ribosomal protein S18 acetylase RimI-like enzyme
MISLKVIRNGQELSQNVVKKLNHLMEKSFPGSHCPQELCNSNDYCFYLSKGSIVYSYVTVRLKDLLGYQYAELWNFCTHPDYRSNGYGTMLFNRTCSYLKRNYENPDFYQLWVLKKNKRAQQFYKRMGFEITGENKELSAFEMTNFQGLV